MLGSCSCRSNMFISCSTYLYETFLVIALAASMKYVKLLVIDQPTCIKYVKLLLWPPLWSTMERFLMLITSKSFINKAID